MLETTEHTSSCYAATANWQTDYPQLVGEQRCDVAVVGAGFTGVSTALRLAERGYDVALTEANRISWGASGRNGGQLIDGVVGVDKIRQIGEKYGKDAAETDHQVGIDCLGVVLDRSEKYSIDCDLKIGFLDVAMRQGNLNYFAAEVERKRAIN
jgi:gamma-glutamylputrescine oxidase